MKAKTEGVQAFAVYGVKSSAVRIGLVCARVTMPLLERHGHRHQLMLDYSYVGYAGQATQSRP